MTDFTTPRTWNIGELITKAMMDVHVRDNFNATWVGTTAGDLDYYVSSVRKSRLGIGSAHQVLKVNSSATAPFWDDVLQKCVVYKTSDQSFSSGSGADIIWEAEKQDSYGWHSTSSNKERITVVEAGWYVPFVKIYFNKDSGGSGNFHLSVGINLNGVGTGNNVAQYDSIDAVSKFVMCGGIPVQMTAGQYLTANFSQDSGGSGKLISGTTTCLFSVLRVG